MRKLSKKGLCSGILPSFISRVQKVPYRYLANPSVKTDYANTISSKLVPATWLSELHRATVRVSAGPFGSLQVESIVLLRQPRSALGTDKGR